MPIDPVQQKAKILAIWGNSVAAAINSLTTTIGSRGNGFTRNVGTTANTLAAGDDSRIVGALQKANNLGDLDDAAEARGSLGLGTAAVANIGSANGQVASGNDTRIVNAVQEGAPITIAGAANPTAPAAGSLTIFVTNGGVLKLIAPNGTIYTVQVVADP